MKTVILIFFIIPKKIEKNFMPNDLLMVELDELHRIWNNSNCPPEWPIVRESRVEDTFSYGVRPPLGEFEICA
jgi:hypothetical protein